MDPVTAQLAGKILDWVLPMISFAIGFGLARWARKERGEEK